MESSERWQPIAPASDEPGQQRSGPENKRRRHAVAVACVQCRGGKAKCDGIRPRCTRCKEFDFACHFDVAEGVSRSERMKLLKKESFSNKFQDMERVMKALRSESDLQATSILARLRLGERVEDVAKSLPATMSSTRIQKPPSLLGQDSTSSSSGLSPTPTAAANDQTIAPFRRDSDTSYPSPAGPRPPWSSAFPNPSSSSVASVKDKGPAAKAVSADIPFRSILFNREDFLLEAISELEEDDEFYEEMNTTIDPRVLEHDLVADVGSVSAASPMQLGGSRTASPHKEQYESSIHVTHLRNRQSIVDTIILHPNFNIRDLFGTSQFPSSVRTDNKPSIPQETQVDNLSIPTWAMMTINTRSDPGSINDAFTGILQEAADMLENGAPLDLVIEKHPNIGALFDEEEFYKSGILSRWAVGMVHSAFLTGNDFTTFALMYIFWYLMRWMISPSAETYSAMPVWLRPTPNQLFMPHIKMLDFVIWPAFREYAVQIPAMQERMEWMVDMSLHIRCDWSLSKEEALIKDSETESLDLSDLAKSSLRDLSSWSVGPSFRAYVSNADTYLRIRTEGY